MKRYEEYKESGVKWIGKVPSHWNYSRIKFGLNSSFSGVWGDDEKGDDNDIVCYRVADFDYKNGGLSEEKITIRNIDEKTFKEREILPNDILIEKSGGGDVNPVGRAVIANLAHRATCSNFIHCVRCNENALNTRLLYYFFYSIYAQKVNLLFFNQTTGIQNLKIPDYLGQIIFLPPLSEQQSIASFLDGKTKPIDAIISKREKQIELLEEMKSAIISRAVTKGLNPNAKMKDSGIEWIREIPTNWESLRVKDVITLLTDYDANGSFADIAANVHVNIGNPYAWMVRATDLANDRCGLVDGNNYCDEDTYNYLSKSSLCPGDVLIAKRGDIGKSYIVPNCDCPMTLAPNTYLLKTDKKMIDNMFFHYFFMSDYGKKQLTINNKSTTIGAIYKDDVKNLRLLLPPKKEQLQIVSYLDAETSKIDARIAKRRRQIELLQEYKQALITDAVTGKIDVRGFNA